MRTTFIAAIVILQISASVASADVLAPIRDAPELVRRLAHVANGDPPPTIQPFRAVVFSLHHLMVSPDPGLGDPSLLQQDLQRLVEAMAMARLTDLQAGDIRVLPQAVAATSPFQPCEILYAHIWFSFQRRDAASQSSGIVLGAVFIEYRQRTIASSAAGYVVCAGPVTPHTFPFFTDFAGPALFALVPNHELENMSELRRNLQQVLDYSFSTRIVQTRAEARTLVRRWAEGK